MTPISHMSPAQLGGRWSVLTRQRLDHERLQGLLTRIETAEGQPPAELLRATSRLVFSHAFAEEAVLWPALRRLLPDSDELTLRVEREHQEICEATALLEDHPDTELIDHTVELLRRDIHDEETDLLPRLQQAATRSTLITLGIAWEAVRRTAPTRTHPVVARRPPGNLLAGLPLSVIDRTRDGLERLGVPTDGLRKAARQMEHAPWFRRGERPETRVSQI